MDEDQYEIDEASGDSEEPICPAPAVDAAKHGRPTKTKIVNTAKPEVQKTRPKAKKDHFASLPDGPLHQNYDTLDLGHGEQPMKRLSPASEGKKILIEDTSPLAEKEELLNIPDEEPLQNEDPLPSGESEQPMEELAELTSPVSKSGKKTVDCQVHLDEGERMQLEALASDYIMLPDLRKLDENNVVMFAVDSLNDKTPPTPKPVVASPDAKFYGVDGYVDLPWDLHYVTEDGIQRGMIFWRELKLAAEQGFTCFNDFETLLLRLHTAKEALGLYDFFEYHSDDDEVLATLTLLHQIVKLALRAPELITAPIPLLITSPGAEHTSVTLSQEQCAALLACSFLGLIPYAEKQENHNEFNLSMFMMQRGDITYQKLCFVFNYFANVICHPPIGVVTFRRDMYPLAKTAFSDESMHKHMSKVAMTRNRIEECPRILQVDFANKYIGGGVMFSGFVQEEIRFLCCPELMVSMLLCPAMKQNEAITISGAQQYSNYEGYGHKTQFCPDVPDSQNQPRDKYNMFKHEWLYTVGLMKDSYRRIMCEVVAIDANEYPSQYIREQFEPKKVNREIRKAFAGFYTELDEKGPVVTGNWGCGAFHGHLQLKCIIQWIAASLAGRDVLYSTFSKEATISYFCDLVRKCRSKGILVGQIYKWLTNYDYSPNNSLFGYLEMRLDRQE